MTETELHRIRARIEEARRNLLELTRRNRLLKYRPSKTLGFSFTVDNAPALWRHLVQDGKRIEFLGMTAKPPPPRSWFYPFPLGAPVETAYGNMILADRA
jgi:hypothetical protein